MQRREIELERARKALQEKERQLGETEQKVVALEKMERIGDGARVTVGSPARDRASKRRVRISAPKPAPAIRQNDAGEKVPA